MYHLNLFKTSFELNAKHSLKESYLQLWNDPRVRSALHRDAQDRPLFLLHDGPPYANGNLHLGHFVNKSLKDTLLKYKRLDGHFAPFVPGFDCHGLPVELEVEKAGVSKEDPAKFVLACEAYARGQVSLQEAEFQDFGVHADWTAKYLTLDHSFEHKAAQLFSGLSQRVKRLRPVHWCARCGSSLAEAEVEYKELKSENSVVVLFQVDGDPNCFLKVWTTTPYTLPANKAVAFAPTTEYVREEGSDGRVFVRARQEGDPAGLPSVSLQGWRVVSPFTQKVVPVVPADYVTSAGTGLVHLAPSFGVDDFRAGEAHGLEAEAYVDDHGKFLHGELRGLSLSQAGEYVLESLGPLLFSRSPLVHEYPHCWRHKTPLFFKASEEWFLDLSDTGEQAQAALDCVKFVPPAGRERLTSMLKTRTSWCVSRNRLWGTPLVDPSSSEDMALSARVATEGLAAWHSNGPRRTLDVWFDSGVTHELVMAERFGKSADVYLEGSDQHRGWFQSSLLTAVAAGKPAPFKVVLTHGFVVDEQGKKYSKSNKNYKSMAELFALHSPDVLRLWALSQDFTKDLKLSKESLDRTVERYRKLRNTLRFCLQNTADWESGAPVALTHVLHRAQVALLSTLVEQTRAAAEAYDFSRCVTLLLQFCEQTSSNYFTAFKDTLYCDAATSHSRREVQQVLSLTLEVLLRLLVPVLPYTAEDVNLQMAGDREVSAVLLTWAGLEWPANPEGAQAVVALEELLSLKQACNQFVEKCREGGKLRSCAELNVHTPLPANVTAREAMDLLGVAQVREGSEFQVEGTTQPPCPRCREHRPLFTALCQRCAEVETTQAQ